MTVISKRGARALAVAAAGTMAFGLMAGTSPSAYADAAPTSTDVVGVGSDTLQYMLDFTADGDYNSNSGNNLGKKDRLVSFDATPDANARAGYLNGSTSDALKPLNPTIVLRAGTSPIQRPNGSGAGITAITNDGTAHRIDFVRSSGVLSDGQVSSATSAAGVGNLHVIRVATDGLGMAVANTTNAVPLSKPQLKDIYLCNKTKWSDVGATGTGSTETIIPIVPQNGSGTRKTFLTDIGFSVASDGTVSPALGGCVKTAEENDPYALYITDAGASSTSANPDAIEPISEGRLDLYQAGYFKDPSKAYNTGGAALTPTVKMLKTGTPSSGALYYYERPLFVIFRDSDVNSTKKYNGSSLNWVRTLFYNPGGADPFVASPAGQDLLVSAGVTPAYADCGNNYTGATSCT